MVQAQISAQREILDRQKDAMVTQAENLQLQRESVRLLGLIAKALERKESN
jgi:hypothetical protein